LAAVPPFNVVCFLAGAFADAAGFADAFAGAFAC
jgi:hypothetical protein